MLSTTLIAGLPWLLVILRALGSGETRSVSCYCVHDRAGGPLPENSCANGSIVVRSPMSEPRELLILRRPRPGTPVSEAPQ